MDGSIARASVPEICDWIVRQFDLTGVRLFADKSDVFGNLLFLGERNGTTLLVKYSETFPDLIVQESRMLFNAGEVIPAYVPPQDRTVIDRGRAAFSMAYLRGRRSLAEILSEGPFPARWLDVFVAQLNEIVTCLEAAGICHRDFEPQNILLDDECRVTVIDWQGAIRRGQKQDLYADWMRASRNRLYETGRDGLGLLAWNDRRHFLIDVKDAGLRARLRPLWRGRPDAGTYRAPTDERFLRQLKRAWRRYRLRLLLFASPAVRQKLGRRCAVIRRTLRRRAAGGETSEGARGT